MSVAMLASLSVNAAAVNTGADLPEEVSYAVSMNAYSGAIGLEFNGEYTDWIGAIDGVEVNGTEYNNGNVHFSLTSHIGRPEPHYPEPMAVMQELNSPEWMIFPPQL